MIGNLSFVRLLVMCAMLAVCLLFDSSAAFAETPQPNEGGEIKCTSDPESGAECNCRDKHPGYFLSVIVPCIRDEVIAVTSRMTNAFAPMVIGITTAFLTLVIVLFGVKILTAEGDPKKDAFVLLIKIAAVVGFLASYDQLIIGPSFAIMQEGVEITTSAFDITSEHCEDFLTKYPDAERPWLHYDCVLGNIMGFGPETFLGASVLGVIGAALFSGQFGMVFVMGAVAAIFFLLKLIIRGTYSYLMAVIALALLIFMSPLLIPLIWMPSTQQYFDRWLNAFMSMIIMPCIIMAYLTLSFILLDKIVFDEDMGIATLMSAEKVQEMQGGRQCIKETVMADPNLANPDGGMSQAQLESDSQFNFLNPLFSGTGSASMLGGILGDCFYYADFTSDEVGAIGKIFFGFVALVLVSYILMAMLEQLISLAQILLGGGFFMGPAVTGSGGNPFERGLTGAQQNMNQSMSGATGAKSMVTGIAQGVVSTPGAIMNSMVGKRN